MISATDRELLELAAKAAGIDVFWWPADDPVALRLKRNNDLWNPLTDDGDALRLAVKLFITFRCETFAEAITPNGNVFRVFASEVDDPYAATRRAIVRAAAEIGKSMK